MNVYKSRARHQSRQSIPLDTKNSQCKVGILERMENKETIYQWEVSVWSPPREEQRTEAATPWPQVERTELPTQSLVIIPKKINQNIENFNMLRVPKLRKIYYLWNLPYFLLHNLQTVNTSINTYYMKFPKHYVVILLSIFQNLNRIFYFEPSYYLWADYD